MANGTNRDNLPDILTDEEIGKLEESQNLPDTLTDEEATKLETPQAPLISQPDSESTTQEDLEKKYKGKEAAAKQATQQADAQAAAAKAQEDDPANWSLEKTKKHYEDNPPKNIEEEAKMRVVIKAKETALNMATSALKNAPIVGGFSVNQLEKGQKALEGVIERPVAGARAVAKEGPSGFIKGLKEPEKYPPGTFGEALVNAGMDQTAAGALGTLADAGYYFGVPEAMTRVISAGKVKLLEGTLNNVIKALEESGRKSNTVPTIDAEALRNAAKDKDVFNIVRSFLKSKEVKFSRVPGQKIEAPVPETVTTPPIAAEQKATTLYRGGPESAPPEGKTALDVIKYETGDLGNKDIKALLPDEELNNIKSENTRWFTTSEETAKEYGEVSKQEIGGHRVIAEDGQGGVLIELSPKKEMTQSDQADEEIGNKIVDLAKSEYTPYEKKSVSIGPADQKTVEVIKNSMGLDASKFTHKVDNYGLRHALNKHSTDPSPLTVEDFKLIPDIIKNPDSIIYAGKKEGKNNTLEYRKKYSGITYYIEEIRTGEKSLSLKTMYKTKTPLGASRAQEELGALRPAHSEPTTPSSVNKSLPQDQGKVNIPIFRIDEDVLVNNTGGDEIKLPKGEEYRAYDLGNGKVRLQDGKQITVFEGELEKLKGHMLKEGEQPKAGGMIHRPKTLTGEILARGGIDPDKVSKDYNLRESFVQFGLRHILKKGGQGLDDLADQFVSEGLLQVPEDRTPGDYLLERIQTSKGREISSGEPTRKQLEESAIISDAAKQKEKEQGIDFNPEEYDREGKMRKFITTVREAEKTAPEVRKQIESRYTPITNQETLAEAQKFVLESYNEALRTAMSVDTPTAFSNAVAQVLIDKAQAGGRWEEARELIERTSERNTSLGQAIQALAMYERLTPEGILRYAESVIKKARESRPAAQVKQFLDAIKKKKTPEEIADLARKMKIPYLDEATMKDLYEHAKRIETMEPGREKSVEMALLLKKIAAQIPRSVWSKISMIQTMAQLLNPKTAIRNILGNAGFMVAENISDTIGTVLDMAVSVATGKRTKYLPNIGVQIHGLRKGFAEGFEEAKLGIDLSGQTSKFSLPRNSIFDEGVLSGLEKTMMVTLKAPDRAFYQAAFNQSLETQMKASGVNDPSIAMIEQAHLDGLYRTFQDDNVLSRAFVTIKKGLNELTGKEWGLGDMVIKYPKTPASILARGIEYSPFNFVSTLWHLTKAALKKDFDQRKFINVTSRATTGSLMVGIGAILAGYGIMTGKGEDDRDVRELQRQVGLGDYRINISALKRFVISGYNPNATKRRKNDTFISYDWFQPQSISLAMGANIGRTLKDGQVDIVTLFTKNSSKLADILSASGQTIVDQPMMSGIRKISSKEDIVESFKDIAKDVPASFVPTFLSQIRQLTDNISRNTKDPDYMKEAYNKVINKIPGASQSLPENISTFGKKQKIYQNDTNNPFNVFLNPSFVSKYQPTKEARMVLKIWEQTGETRHFPRAVKSPITIAGQKIDLYGQQYLEYQKYVGNKTGVLYQVLANDGDFMSSQNEEKAKRLSKYLTDINTAAKIELLGYRPQRVNADVITIIRDLGRFYKANNP